MQGKQDLQIFILLNLFFHHSSIEELKVWVFFLASLCFFFFVSFFLSLFCLTASLISIFSPILFVVVRHRKDHRPEDCGGPERFDVERRVL